MSSVLQGGRRRRRPGARLARLLLVLAPVAVVVAFVVGTRHDSGSPQPAKAPLAQGQEAPGATPSPGTAAPDPAQAALAGVDAFHLAFHDPPRAGIVFNVKTGEVLWRRNPLKRTQIASITKIMTALLVDEQTGARDQTRTPKDARNYRGSGVG